MRSSGNSNVQLCKLLQRNRAHNSLLYKQGLYYINIPEKNLKNSHDHAPLFHFEFLRHFSTKFGVIFIKRVGFEGVFLDEVGSDCALDALPTDGALGEGTVRTNLVEKNTLKANTLDKNNPKTNTKKT